MIKMSNNKTSNQSLSQRLGINIDHVATIRNARGIAHPCPIYAAQLAKNARADGITAHLREDRRHIRDADIYRLKNEVDLPLNMEMAATDEMLAIALDVKPNACCIVPEKREELTTEGGLNVANNIERLRPICDKLRERNIRISLFIDPDERQLEASAILNADIVELHTGHYCELFAEGKSAENKLNDELMRIKNAAKIAESLGIECHAGHGLSYNTVQSISIIPQVVELNIGHFLIGQAIFDGLPLAINKMRKLMR